MPFPDAVRVCECIAEGDSVAKACDDLKLNTRSFYRALLVDPQIEQQYVRARKARADSRAEEIDDLKRRMCLPKKHAEYIDAQTGRVMMDCIKWQAGKENNGRYGDKLTIEAPPVVPQSRQEQLDTLKASGVDLMEIIDVVVSERASQQIADSEQPPDGVEVVDA